MKGAPINAPLWSIHPANLLTYASLAAGIGSVAAALQHSAAGAGAFLALAALADTFDGRFARLFTRGGELEALGVQLDSLSDAVAFGAAPVAAVGILLSAQAAGPWAVVWWIAAIGYAGCALTRLACYNVSQAADGRAFVGVPTPVAALVWSSVLLTGIGIAGASLVAVVLGLGMVAPLRISRPGPTGLTLFALWPIGLLVVYLAHR
jgi:CDP-diacylglycerol---serine O-phosphatidyltransferase